MSDHINVEFVNPPVPFRDMDYCATFEGYGPTDWAGWGATKDAAIADLLDIVADLLDLGGV